jgi:hypothetical protein
MSLSFWRDRCSAVDWLQPAGATPPPSPELHPHLIHRNLSNLSSLSNLSASALAIPATTLTRPTILTTHTLITIHAPGRRLVLLVLLRVARLHAASLPLAQSLRKPGCLGDAVGRFLPRFALELRRAPFAAVVAGCAPPRCVIAPRPELEKAWLFGRRSRPPPASVRPQTSRCILLNLTAAPCPPAPSLPPASPCA